MLPMVCGLSGAAVAWSLPALAPIVAPVAHALRIARTIADPGAVALTFDDGPHPEGTPAVLEALREAGAAATFFLMGEQCERHPALAAEVVAAGHAVAVHAHRHRTLLRLGPRAVAEDLDRAHDAIARATGQAPVVHRAPYGIYSPAALGAVRRRGWTPLLWSRWGRDWAARATPGRIAAEVTDGLRGGDVLLLHDADWYSVPGSHRATAAALPAVLAEVRRRGLHPVRVAGAPAQAFSGAAARASRQ
ncbi:MAG TPA: polysaccharide deacetylase family protein [Solirubrobacteraceae bacterium]|nr:polysaccharide deacetylase family protein [Solirubrobacteraceae bacterium]